MENYGYYTWHTELYHSGTKGMKWGQRLYQYKDGSLTPLGKRRYGRNSEFKKSIDRENALKKARETKEAKKKAAEEEAKRAEERQKVVKSGDIDLVMKYKSELTKAEMDEAYARIKWAKDVNELRPQEVDAGKSKAEKFFDTVDDLTGYAQTSFKAWNTIANVVNAAAGEKVMGKIEVDNSGKPDKNDNKNNQNNNNQNKDKNKGNNQQKDNSNNDNSNQQTSSKSDKKTDKQTAKEQAKADKKAKKQAEKEAKKAAKEAAKEEKKVYTGTVEGEGRSTYKEKEGPIIDGEWRDIPNSNMKVSDVPDRVYTAGESYVAGLLEDKRR